MNNFRIVTCRTNWGFSRVGGSYRVLLAALFMLLMLAIQPALAGKNYESFALQDAPAGKYVLDKTHGYITFSYSHQGYSRPWLRFRSIDSTLEVNSSDVNQSVLDVVVDTDSIDSGVDVFDEHLRGDKFFDVAKYPTIKFAATEVVVEGANVSITGDLTIKDTTKPVTLEGVFNKGGLHFRSKKPMLGFSASVSLKRSEWGMGQYVPVVGDAVDVVIEVEYVREAPLAPKPKG